MPSLHRQQDLTKLTRCELDSRRLETHRRKILKSEHVQSSCTCSSHRPTLTPTWQFWSVCVTVGWSVRLSVRPSVCPIIQPQRRQVCCRARRGQEISIDSGGRRAPGSDFATFYSAWNEHPFNGLFPGLPGWASTRKVQPIWILLKQETASGSGISWAICKSAPRSRQITTPAPHLFKFFTSRMPFLPPNQQRQSTEDNLFSVVCDDILTEECAGRG